MKCFFKHHQSKVQTPLLQDVLEQTHNRFKRGLDKFTDDRPMGGIKHNLMQPLAPTASEPLSWQKWGQRTRGRIILMPRLYILYPLRSPHTPLKTDKPLVWSWMAILAFRYNRNMTAAHVLFITQIVWSCFICWYKVSVSGTVVSTQWINCSVYQSLSLASVVSHLYKPITSCILVRHNDYGFINLPRAPAKTLVMLSVGKLLSISCIFVEKSQHQSCCLLK